MDSWQSSGISPGGVRGLYAVGLTRIGHMQGELDTTGPKRLALRKMWLDRAERYIHMLEALEQLISQFDTDWDNVFRRI